MKKALIIAGIIIGIAVLVWFFRKRLSKKKAAQAQESAPPPSYSAPKVPRQTNNAASGVLNAEIVDILRQINASLLSGGKTAAPVGVNLKKILKKGSKSVEVILLQRGLNKFFGESLQDDGEFGSATEAALLRNTNLKQISLEKAISLLRNQGLL